MELRCSAVGLAALSEAQYAAFSDFGTAVGLAFQIQDDILDVEGDVAVIGKPPGSDEARGLPTYPALAGLEGARQRVVELTAEAMAALSTHGWEDSPLAGLAAWLLGRRH